MTKIFNGANASFGEFTATERNTFPHVITDGKWHLFNPADAGLFLRVSSDGLRLEFAAASTGGTIGGSGTINTVAKFTPDGVTIGDSSIFDDGLKVVIASGVNVGIGTSSPTTDLHVVGGFRYVDGFEQAGRFLMSDANGNATWQDITDNGITSLNGLTAISQTFAVGTSGTDFGISSAGSVHTFNLPTASGTNRGALSSADWSTFNGKQGAITLTTLGSGAATLIADTLNIPTPSFSGWDLLGNTLVGDTNFIGSISNHDFSIYTNNTERVRVLKSGEIGIGTSAPSTLLHVNGVGSFRYVDGNQSTTSYLKSDANGVASWASLPGAIAGSAWSLTGNAGTVAGTNFIGTTDAVDFVLKTNAVERLRVLSGGQIGINVAPTVGTEFRVFGRGTDRTTSTAHFGSVNDGNCLVVRDGNGAFGGYVGIQQINALEPSTIFGVGGRSQFNGAMLFGSGVLSGDTYNGLITFSSGNYQILGGTGATLNLGANADANLLVISTAKDVGVKNNLSVGFLSPAPSARLHVVGSGSTSATTTALFLNSASHPTYSIFDDGSVFFNVKNGAVNAPFRVTANTNNANISGLSAGMYVLTEAGVGSSSTEVVSMNGQMNTTEPTVKATGVLGVSIGSNADERIGVRGLGRLGIVSSYGFYGNAEHEFSPTNYGIYVKGANGSSNSYGGYFVSDNQYSTVATAPAHGTYVRSDNWQNSGFAYGSYIDVRNVNSATGGTLYGLYVKATTSNGTSTNYAIVVPSGGGSVGVGTSTPSAALHVVGTGATSATYALKVENSASSPLFNIQDNGAIGIGIASASFALHMSKSGISGGGVGAYFNLNGGASLDAMQVDASATSGTLRAIYGAGISDTGASSNVGLYGTAKNGTASSIGVFGNIGGGAATTSGYTASFFANNAELLSNENYGFYANVTPVSASATNYGYYASVTGAGTINYGLYTSVSGASTNYAAILMGGNVGINTTSPSARLHVVGTNATFGTNAFRVDGSTGTPRFVVDDAGYTSVGFGAVPINGHWLNVNGLAATSDYIASFYSGGVAAMIVRGHPSLGGTVGIGINPPDADVRLHVKGLGATSATTNAYFQNSTGSSYFRAKDNGVGGGSAVDDAAFTFRNTDNSIVLDVFRVASSSVNNALVLRSIGSSTAYWYSDATSWMIGTANLGFLDSSIKLRIKGIGNGSMVSSQTLWLTDSLDTMYFNTRDNGTVGVGRAGNGDERFIVTGRGNGTDKTLLIENSSNVVRLKILDNGLISMPTLQTGNAGLVAGDLYKDTAANVLANGDYVVGMKA